MSKKEQIILESLRLFSSEGSSAISVRDIATAVNIKAPSLYKHFKSKEEIVDQVLLYCDRYYQKEILKIGLNGIDPSQDIEFFRDMDSAFVKRIGLEIFDFFMEDTIICRYRKWLTIEQFENKALCLKFSKLYFDDPLSYQTTLFTELFGLEEEQAKVFALIFFGPIYTLISLSDRQPQRLPATRVRLENHLDYISRSLKDLHHEEH